MEAFVWTSYGPSGHQLSPFLKCCCPFVRSCAIRTRTIHWSPRLPGYTKRTGSDTMNWHANGPVNMPCDDDGASIIFGLTATTTTLFSYSSSLSSSPLQKTLPYQEDQETPHQQHTSKNRLFPTPTSSLALFTLKFFLLYSILSLILLPPFSRTCPLSSPTLAYHLNHPPSTIEIQPDRWNIHLIKK